MSWLLNVALCLRSVMIVFSPRILMYLDVICIVEYNIVQPYQQGHNHEEFRKRRAEYLQLRDVGNRFCLRNSEGSKIEYEE